VFTGFTIRAISVTDLDYNILEPAVEADGNDINGIRSPTPQAPLGTYMGWNYRASDYGEGDLCDLSGNFIPFAPPRQSAREW